MNDTSHDWFDRASVRASIAESPLALAVMEADGQAVTMNERFVAARARLAAGGSQTEVEIPLPDERRLVVLADEDAAARIEALERRVVELQQLSATDRLTGAWNRLHLDRMVEREIGGAMRYRQPLSMILLDVDHFKRVNDVHGHQAGDEVLKRLVACVREATRPSDGIYRWGGEEFVLLVPNTPHRSAALLAERVRTTVERLEIPPVGHVTVSLGVAELLPGEDLTEWFARADRSVYAAKDGGRNRVVCDGRGASETWTHDSGGVLELVWRDRYASGNVAIDSEHRKLFDLANRLLTASLADGDVGVRVAIDELTDHVAAHFAHEEQLLAERGFEHLEAHRRAHRRLLGRALELKRKVHDQGVGAGELAEFLAHEVVSRHMVKCDSAFFPLFIAG